MKKKYEADFNDPRVSRWINSILKRNTLNTYKSAFRKYSHHTQMTGTQMINEAFEDQEQPLQQKTDIVKSRILKFYKWIKEEAPVEIRRGKKTVVRGKGSSDKSALLACNAIRSFYSVFNITVKLKGISRLPDPRVVNKRMKITNIEFKKLVDFAPSLRDRAILYTLFTSGMDVSTLSSLKHKDVTDIWNKDKPRALHLPLFRQKTQTEYYTFITQQCEESIRTYVQSIENKVTITPETPLFIRSNYKEIQSITPHLIQIMMKKIAIETGLVSASNNGYSFNPLSPHALRKSFGSICISHGVPDILVDIFLGHKVREIDTAYKSIGIEDARRIYNTIEPHLSINISNHKDVKNLKNQTVELQNIVVNLYSENKSLRQIAEKLIKKRDEDITYWEKTSNESLTYWEQKINAVYEQRDKDYAKYQRWIEEEQAQTQEMKNQYKKELKEMKTFYEKQLKEILDKVEEQREKFVEIIREQENKQE